MAGVYIRGMGLNCALGKEIEGCVLSMERMQVNPQSVLLTELNEPLTVRYYLMGDQSDPFCANRFDYPLASVAKTAVAQAELTASEIRGLPLFIGSSCFTIDSAESRYAVALEEQPDSAIPMPICGYQDIATFLQCSLGCSGETYTYNTACTASANALMSAQRMIELGWHANALVIGYERINRTTLAGFSGLQILAETLRPFDSARTGIVLGEGIGAIVLSEKSGAADCLRIIGGASNCDTSSITTADPDGYSVAAVLKKALENTNTLPKQIRGIKAHGTATRTGDRAEAYGMRDVFTNLPPISALKPYLGHTLGACGINELVLYSGALLRGFLPATPGFTTPDSDLGVHPIHAAIPAPGGYYLLNHFGFGGNNTALVMEKRGF